MTLVSTNIKTDIIQWLHYEKKISEYDVKIKSVQPSINNIKMLRDKLSEKIILYMELNNLTNNDIKVGLFRLKYKTTNTKVPVTRTLIEKRLTEYLKSSSEAKKATDFIYNERESNSKSMIKKYIIKDKKI